MSTLKISSDLQNVIKKIVLDTYYPAGKIYITVGNEDPNNTIGGTWEVFGTGKCLVGVDSSQSEFNTVMKTGGEKTHTLTINEMPSHNHHFFRGTDGTSYFGVTGKEPDGGSLYQVDTSSAGGGQSHNNLQPYITVYMWKRTA